MLGHLRGERIEKTAQKGVALEVSVSEQSVQFNTDLGKMNACSKKAA